MRFCIAATRYIPYCAAKRSALSLGCDAVVSTVSLPSLGVSSLDLGRRKAAFFLFRALSFP